jgi:hypothetical protein
MKKFLIPIAVVFVFSLSSCKETICDRLIYQRDSIIFNADNLKADDELKLIQQTDSMIVVFCDDPVNK